jgi:hypothetical protein
VLRKGEFPVVSILDDAVLSPELVVFEFFRGGGGGSESVRHVGRANLHPSPNCEVSLTRQRGETLAERGKALIFDLGKDRKREKT